MFNCTLPPDAYLLKQRSAKWVDHYGCLLVSDSKPPVIYHLTRDGIKRDRLQDNPEWLLLGQSGNAKAAFMRLSESFNRPCYRLVSNNCEHFARYVVTGRHESAQVQEAVVAGVLLCAFLTQEG